jgi:hypothetical protein
MWIATASLGLTLAPGQVSLGIVPGLDFTNLSAQLGPSTWLLTSGISAVLWLAFVLARRGRRIRRDESLESMRRRYLKQLLQRKDLTH